ncbi:MAG: hypothetical protein BWY74_01317 [Firmicutes bacterium ADurb.Bin419]|nr:MAG: hypothetical protein BWY74_01317 [Firmicutes bacterium ADurb.Bin419]
MEIIDRYIYAVTKDLPEKQRDDIKNELRTLIDDMVEENEGSESYEKKVERVLIELGDPRKLAENYSDLKRYLIGPQIFDQYLLVLKICIGAVCIGISVATFIGSIFSGTGDVVQIISYYITSLLSGVIQAFAWTTLAFAIAERIQVSESKNKSVNDDKNKEWTLADLPEIPEKNSAISRSDSIVTIVFTTILMSIIMFRPSLFGVHIPKGSEVTVIPFLDGEVVKSFMILFGAIFVVSILKEVFKLISKRWTLKLSVFVAASSLISAALTLYIFAHPGIWNPDFAYELTRNFKLEFDILSVWSNIKIIFVVIIAVTYAAEIGKTLYVGFKNK